MRYLFLFFINLSVICGFAENLITDYKAAPTQEELELRDYLNSQIDSSFNSPTLIKKYAGKYVISCDYSDKIEIYPVELIDMYNDIVNQYVVFSVGGKKCLLNGHDVSLINKALDKMQTYLLEFPQDYEEGLSFNYEVGEKLISFGLIKDENKTKWKGVISILNGMTQSYCISSDVYETLFGINYNLNRCLNDVEERLRNPKDKKYVRQEHENGTTICYYTCGESTSAI